MLVAGACTSHRSHEPSAEQAAANYLAVHNDHDREAARELWGETVDETEPLVEWFRAQVGACRDFSPMRVTDHLHARFVFDCEHGQLEVELRVDETTGAVERTLFGARGVEPPAHVRAMAEQLVALANGESATLPPLAASLDHAQVQKQLDRISVQGRCRIDRVHLGTRRGARFVLECTHGSRTMLVDLNDEGALRRFGSGSGAADAWRGLAGSGS